MSFNRPAGIFLALGFLAALVLMAGCVESGAGGNASDPNAVYIRGTNGGYAEWQMAAAQQVNGGILREAALGNPHAIHDIFQVSLDPTLESVQTNGPTLMALFRELGPQKFIAALKQENLETRKAVVGACQFASPELKRTFRQAGL